MKIYIDVKDAKSPTALHERLELHKLYKDIPIHKDFAELKKAHFKEIFERRLNQKRPRTEVDTGVLDRAYDSLGPPPSADD